MIGIWYKIPRIQKWVVSPFLIRKLTLASNISSSMLRLVVRCGRPREEGYMVIMIGNVEIYSKPPLVEQLLAENKGIFFMVTAIKTPASSRIF
jgi:hypothetical protein